MNACGEWVVPDDTNRKNVCATLSEFAHESFLVERVDYDVGCACIARTTKQKGVFLGKVLAHMLSKPVKWHVVRFALINDDE